MPQRLKVYLAGPITNCNPKQRSHWRSKLKVSLRDAGFQVLDPTAEGARVGALAVSADIAEADIVIANMWRESIGTVLGIVQAQRLGIPVILIDKNYMDSEVLNSLVDDVIHAEKDAMAKVQAVAKSVSREIFVEKNTSGGLMKEEPFSFAKLQRSLKASCTLAGIDDPIFCTLLSKRVKQVLLAETDKANRIKSEDISRHIFHELNALSRDKTQLSMSDQIRVQANAKKMQENWRGFSEAKRGKREADEIVTLYSNDLDDLKAEIEILAEKLATNELSLLASTSAKPSAEDRANAFAAKLQSLLANKRGLCVIRNGAQNFRSIFTRLGLSEENFERFFQEKICDGKQSNLNSDIKKWIEQYGVVLYASDGLRHLSDPKVKNAGNLYHGCGPNDCVRKLLAN